MKERVKESVGPLYITRGKDLIKQRNNKTAKTAVEPWQIVWSLTKNGTQDHSKYKNSSP